MNVINDPLCLLYARDILPKNGYMISHVHAYIKRKIPPIKLGMKIRELSYIN
jgi:hypothetical protein